MGAGPGDVCLRSGDGPKAVPPVLPLAKAGGVE
jgi:hypothetical protein